MILKYNTENTKLITLDEEALEDVESFTYLKSIIDEQEGFDAVVNASIGKTRTVFPQSKNMCSSKQPSTNVKVRIFNMNVEIVLLYEAETWTTTTVIIQKCTSICKQLSRQYTQRSLTGYHEQQVVVRENKPASN
ncbi:unnamed protein product [Schistosoma mattheei]|uniref:Uncharacterized protein n=1 Tax=Schistosoma mattheei TaxID=31246 RepID=A0A183NJ81_9TREM|nr:unnamed protein product [Schistosoma mattheei]